MWRYKSNHQHSKNTENITVNVSNYEVWYLRNHDRQITTRSWMWAIWTCTRKHFHVLYISELSMLQYSTSVLFRIENSDAQNHILKSTSDLRKAPDTFTALENIYKCSYEIVRKPLNSGMLTYTLNKIPFHVYTSSSSHI